MSELTNAELAAMETKPARDPWIKSVRASGSWLRPMRTRISIREFNFVIDQPVIKGGENDAPTPMEFLAGAVNGCITVTIEAVATELGIRLDQIETLTRSHIDVRGFTGTADVSPHFSDYSLLVQIVRPPQSLNSASFVAQWRSGVLPLASCAMRTSRSTFTGNSRRCHLLRL